MKHRCAIHPCREDCEDGHSTCAGHLEQENDLHERYHAHRKDERERQERTAAEREAMNELMGKRVDAILARRRQARGEIP